MHRQQKHFYEWAEKKEAPVCLFFHFACVADSLFSACSQVAAGANKTNGGYVE